MFRSAVHFADDTGADFRDEIAARFSPGDTLVEILAVRAKGAEPEPIGELVLDSGFVASEFGDQRLHFWHSRSPEKN